MQTIQFIDLHAKKQRRSAATAFCEYAINFQLHVDHWRPGIFLKFDSFVFSINHCNLLRRRKAVPNVLLSNPMGSRKSEYLYRDGNLSKFFSKWEESPHVKQKNRIWVFEFLKNPHPLTTKTFLPT